MEPTILLMFLGSAPNTDNIINHWIILNEENNINDNIHIVIHPFCINNYNIDNKFKKLFNNNNIYIVDNDHHVKTSWGSHSLTCATLLMIQYAQINHNNFFDKYILLSPSCCPLYSLNDLYNILTDINIINKSWFAFYDFNNIYEQNIINKLYNKICIKTSQWMIIDKKHIYYFFYNKAHYKTYVKNDNNNLINDFIKLNPYLLTIDQSNDFNFYNIINYYKYNDYLILKNEDTNTDETYFLNWILLLLLYDYKSDINKLLNYNQFTDINKCIENNFIIFNHNNICERAILLNKKLIDKLIDQDLINSNDIYYLNETRDKSGWYININNNTSINLLKKNLLYRNINNLIKIENNKNINWNKLYNNYTLPCTYIDNMTIVYAINPFVMIRTTNNITNKKLNELLYLPLNNNSLDIIYNNINKLNLLNESNPFISVSDHPIEFSTFNLLNIINIYFIYLYIFEKNINEASYFTYIYNIIADIFNINDYKYNLESQLNIIINKININPNLLNKKYGTYITSKYILSAILHNSLFIRKCDDTSLINTFSSILKSYNKYNITENHIKNFEIKNYTISNDILYHNIINIRKSNNNKLIIYKGKQIIIKN